MTLSSDDHNGVRRQQALTEIWPSDEFDVPVELTGLQQAFLRVLQEKRALTNLLY